jgi:tRNA threonylcarbamoyladenosine biosynthesis protein TsaE
MERIYKENELSEIASYIKNEVDSCDVSGAVLVTFSGDLGAGKTTLIQEIARQFGIQDTVISPTYVIMKKYDISQGGKFENLIHIDAYRIESEDEIGNIGWNEYMANSKNLIFVEWPERVSIHTKNPTLHITLTHHNDDSRKIAIVRYTDK